MKQDRKYISDPFSEDITPTPVGPVATLHKPTQNWSSAVADRAVLLPPLEIHTKTMKKKNNTYRTKGRAVFLAAIMIISVLAMPLAFSGVAAADATDISNQSIEDVRAGAIVDYQEVSFDITLGADDEETITLDLSNATAADAEPFLSSVTTNEENVTGDGTINNDDELVLTISANGDHGGDPVTVTVNLVHGLADVEPVNNVEVGVTSSSGQWTGSVTFDVSGVDIEAQNRAYEGQYVQSTNATNAGDEVELIRDPGDDDEFIDVEEAAADGLVFFDTAGLETGEQYAFVNADTGATIGTFQLTANRYSAEWDENEVNNAGDTTVDVELDANRGTYTVHVTADGLDSDEIFEIFEDSTEGISGDAYETDDGVILVDIRDNDFEADFDDVEPGDYEFEFNMVDTVASDSSTITVVEGDDSELELVDQNVDVSQGDIAEIEIDNVGGADDGTLIIGDFDDDGYQAIIHIEDIDEDVFTIEFNTYLAGLESPPVSIVSSDDADVTLVNLASSEQSGIDGILDLGDYDLYLGAGLVDETDSDAVETFIDNANEVGALFVEARNIGEMNLWTASSSNAGDIEDVDDVVAAIEAGAVTETAEIAFGDALVHQIEIDGIGGFFAATDESDLDDALIVAIEAGVVDIEMEQTDETRQANRRAKLLNSSNLTADAIEVIYEGGELFVVMPEFPEDEELWTDARTPSDGDRFTVDLVVTDQRLLEEDDQEALEPVTDDVDEEDYLTIGSEFGVADREGEFINLNSEDQIEVEVGENQAITAETNIAPGSELTIRANGEGDARFVKTLRDLVVQPDGTVVGELDFSDRNVGEEFTVQLRGGNFDERPEEDGIIVETIAEEEPVEEEPEEEEPVEEEPVEEEPEEEEPVEETEDDTPGFGALVALLAILGAALLAARRQN